MPVSLIKALCFDIFTKDEGVCNKYHMVIIHFIHSDNETCIDSIPFKLISVWYRQDKYENELG